MRLRDERLAPYLLLIVATATVCAGTDAAPPSGPAVDEITARILAEERDTVQRIVGLGRIRLSFPQRLSGAAGAMLTRQPASYECSTVCEFKGLFVQAEPGYSGGQLSVGYADVMGEKPKGQLFLSRVYLAYGVRAALLRTWNRADLRPSDRTLIGVEGDFTVIGVNFSLGLFRGTGSDDSGNRWSVTGGVGWGF